MSVFFLNEKTCIFCWLPVNNKPLRRLSGLQGPVRSGSRLGRFIPRTSPARWAASLEISLRFLFGSPESSFPETENRKGEGLGIYGWTGSTGIYATKNIYNITQKYNLNPE